MGRHRTDQSGGIITGWLGRLVIIMAILAFVGYEVVTVGLNAVNAEDAAQEVARAGRRGYIDARQSEEAAEEYAQAEADARDVELLRLVVDGEFVEAEIRRTADTLVLHSVSLFDSLTTRTAASRLRWRE